MSDPSSNNSEAKPPTSGKSASKLVRAKGKLRKKLQGGFARVVFAPPGDAGASGDGGAGQPQAEPEVHEQGGEAPNDARFDELFALAQAAAARGWFKHTWVLDDTRRLEVDARHGFVKLRTRDAATVQKVMGGKDRPLRPDRSAALLRAIGIMNPDGSIPARRAKKYKQVNHLVELARPSLAHLLSKNASKRRSKDGDTKDRPLRVLDLACGNAYLSFVLAETLRLEEQASVFCGVDSREDLVSRCRDRAATLDFSHMHFCQGSIRDALEVGSETQRAVEALGGTPDLLLALHACDTATDEAIALGILRGVPAMMVVPCCQAELARELGPDAADKAPPALIGHGRFRRAYADLLTDALRVEVLEAAGYEVAVVEFVSSEHSAKNTLLRAQLTRRGKLSRARFDGVRARCEALGVSLSLMRQLDAAIG